MIWPPWWVTLLYVWGSWFIADAICGFELSKIILERDKDR